MSSTHLTKIYEQINKQYKAITCELIDEIIRKFDSFADVYIDNAQHLSTKGKKSLANELITKRILKNEKCNEVSSISTILNFILNMFIFMSIYESNEPERLFKGYSLFDCLLITELHKATLPDVKNNKNMNDENIINTFNRFIKITDEEIFDLMKKSKN